MSLRKALDLYNCSPSRGAALWLTLCHSALCVYLGRLRCLSLKIEYCYSYFCPPIQRSARGELHLWVNGHDCGAAASGLPTRLWAVVDLYGKCTQVTVVSCEPPSSMERDTERETVEGHEEVVVCGVREGDTEDLTSVVNLAAATNGTTEEGRSCFCLQCLCVKR